jgi:hypothetical protein
MGYIDSGKKDGATVHLGGERHGDEGLFIRPTIFTDVKPEMRIVREEIFGPVGVVIPFDTEEGTFPLRPFLVMRALSVLRRGGCRRERHDVRARGRRVLERHPACAPRRAQPERRLCLGQLCEHDRPPDPLRRLQAVRNRARVWRIRAGQVRTAARVSHARGC